MALKAVFEVVDMNQSVYLRTRTVGDRLEVERTKVVVNPCVLSCDGGKGSGCFANRSDWSLE